MKAEFSKTFKSQRPLTDKQNALARQEQRKTKRKQEEQRKSDEVLAQMYKETAKHSQEEDQGLWSEPVLPHSVSSRYVSLRSLLRVSFVVSSFRNA